MSSIIEYIKQYNSEHPEFTYKNSISVSKCIEYLTPEFDSEKVANEMYQKYFNTPDHKYYQKTPEMILEMWEEKRNASLAKGKLFDSYVEQILEIKNAKEFHKWKITEGIEYNEFMQKAMIGFRNILTYLKECGYDTVIGTEIPLWIKINENNRDYIVNGRCDCLMYNSKDKKYLIIDWKTNEAIKSSGFNKMKGPLNHLDACELHKYTTQIYFYKKAICETYGLADYEHIDVMICQMGRASVPYYKIFLPDARQYLFTSKQMNQIIKYCFDVNDILKNEN